MTGDEARLFTAAEVRDLLRIERLRVLAEVQRERPDLVGMASREGTQSSAGTGPRVDKRTTDAIGTKTIVVGSQGGLWRPMGRAVWQVLVQWPHRPAIRRRRGA